MSVKKQSLQTKSNEKTDSEKIKELEDSLQILVKDLALLAKKCHYVIENSQIPGDLLESGAEAKILCKHVIDRWIKDDK